MRAARIGAGIIGAALADLAAPVDGGLPRLRRDQAQRGLLPLAQRPADGVGQLEAAAASQLVQVSNQGVAGPGPVVAYPGCKGPKLISPRSCRRGRVRNEKDKSGNDER